MELKIKKKIKKIAFLGNFYSSYTSETYYCRTFNKLGINTFLLQEGKASSELILEKALASDMFFWVHTHGWHTMGMDRVLDILKTRGIPTVGYHLDLWLGLQRQKDLQSDIYWNIDYFFSVDRYMAEYLNEKKNIKAFYLPAGVFEEEAFMWDSSFPTAPNLPSVPEIVFVGSKNYHPEWSYRVELINFLEKTYGSRFGLFGKDSGVIVRGEALNELYAKAKIVVGDNLTPGFDYPFYFSDRLFETTGRGGFLIYPFIGGIDDFFVLQKNTGNGFYDLEKTELVVYPFKDFDYLKYLIDYFLNHEEEREAIRKRGFLRAKKEHTYTQRLLNIIKRVEEEESKKH